MEERWNDRTRLLLGESATARLAAARVFIAGVGGVGGYAAEMLARSGVGHLTLVDADCVSVTNLNRQIIAVIPDIGKPKTDLFERRFLDINPEIRVTPLREFISPDNVADMLSGGFDYVIDAIDTVAPKVALLAHCLQEKIPVIYLMGTREDGLARAVRQRLKKMGLRRRLDVVASSEAPHSGAVIELDERNKRSSYGTIATIPSVFGILLAAKVINNLTSKA